MKTALQQTVDRALSDLLLAFPAFGTLALRLPFFESHAVPTLATNGRRVLVNPAYWDTLDRHLKTSAIAHEVMHCVLGHPWRHTVQHNQRRWLLATDYEVNAALVLACMRLGDGWVYSNQYDGMSCDRIYRLLPEDDNDSDGQDSTGGPGSGRCSCVEPAPDDIESQEQWGRAVAAIGRGDSGGVGELLSGLVRTSCTDWRQALRMHLQRASGRGDYTYSRPNKAYIQRGLYLPSQTSTIVDIDVVVDTSGSVVFAADILAAFLGEVCNLHSELGGTTRLVYADDRVQAVHQFAPGEVFDPNVVRPVGGLGTAFSPAVSYLRDEGKHAPIIYLTDGDGAYGDEAEDVIWAIPQSSYRVAPWGINVVLEDV